MKKIGRIIVLFLLLLFTAICVLFLYYGISHLFMSIWLHYLFFLGVSVIISFFLPKWKGTNWQILFWSSFISLLILELGLRFVTKSNLSYTEKNGSFWYTDSYKQVKLENYVNRKIFKINDVRLRISRPGHCKNYTKVEFNYSHCFNDLGIRDRDHSKGEIDSSYVILGLGDSFTEGVGAPQDSTWISLLQKKLSPKHGSLLTVNCGNSGSDIVFETYKLKNYFLEHYSPGIVILALNNSDIHDIIVRGGNERFVSKNKVVYRKGPWWSYVYAISHTFRLFIHDLLKIGWHLFSDSDYQQEAQTAINIIQHTIEDELIPLAAEKKFKLMIVFTPQEYEIEKDSFLLSGLYDSLINSNKTYCKFSLISTFKEIYKREKNLRDYYWNIDLHCKPEGYNVWANHIAIELLDKEWLPNIYCN